MSNVEEGKRPQFGGRVLGEGDDVFKHNAWDNVDWGEEQEQTARKAVEEAAAVRVAAEAAEQYEEEADKYWDTFYGIHQNRFFKERNWLFTEFPDLAPNYKAPVRVFKNKESNEKTNEEEFNTNENKQENENRETNVVEESKQLESEVNSFDQEAVLKLREGESWFGENSTFRVLEIGCGTGSTVYPILEVNTDSGLMVYSCDLSITAVNLVKEHKDYSQQRCNSFVCDVTKDWSEAPFQPESLDIVTAIFVLSAIHPDKMEAVATNIFKYLKPGGQIFFRDYGRYDMAQLRFKKGKCIQENFYVRGDGTRCYFFTQKEIEEIFTKVGFVQTQNLVDRRLQILKNGQTKKCFNWSRQSSRRGAWLCETGAVITLLGAILLALGGSIKTFGVLYSLGNITAIFSTCFLVGPMAQLEKMFAKTRIIASIVMIISLVLTLCSAFWWNKKILALLFTVIQFLAMTWYSISYIPYARDAIVSCCNKMIG